MRQRISPGTKHTRLTAGHFHSILDQAAFVGQQQGLDSKALCLPIEERGASLFPAWETAGFNCDRVCDTSSSVAWPLKVGQCLRVVTAHSGLKGTPGASRGRFGGFAPAPCIEGSSDRKGNTLAFCSAAAVSLKCTVCSLTRWAEPARDRALDI